MRCLALGTVLVGMATVAVAQESGTTETDLGNSGLRTGSGFDPSWDLRSDSVPPFSAPLKASRDQTPGEPLRPDILEQAAPPADADDPSAADEAAGATSVPRRPKLDLFEGPSAERATRRNAAVEPATPAGALRDDTEASTGYASGKEARRADRPSTSRRNDASSAAGKRERDRRLRGGDVSLPSAPVRSARIGTVNERLNLRAAPLRGTFPAAPDDAFAPVGVRLGGFVLTSAVDQSIGVSSNLAESPGGAGGAFSDTTLSARFLSDWSRHSAELNALANYRRNFAGEEVSDPDVVLDGRLRLDIDRSTAATLRGGFVYRREDAADLDSPAEEGERPDLLNYSTGVDLDRRFGRALARASLSAVRETTSARGDGSSALDENFNTYTGALRAGYQISPALGPFVEASLGRRVFDDGRDLLDQERDSTIQTLRAGLAFDLGEKLTGEVAGGYGWNIPDAETFGTVGAPTIDARIAWSPQRGTDVALTASTTFDPDTAGSATATLYEAGIAARHRATARLDLDAALTAGYRDSQLDADEQRTWGTSAGFTYWLNRSLAVVGSGSHQRIDRLNEPGDYDVTTAKLGLRLQN